VTENSILESAQPDTSSFVEHLRLVHFTLIAACLISLIAITSQETSSAARAYEQTSDLVKANSRWHFGQWAAALIKQRRPAIFQSKGVVGREQVTVDVVDPPKSGGVADLLSRERLAANLTTGWRLTDIGSASMGRSIAGDFRIADNDDNSKRERSPDFNNLDGATKIWDRLYRFQYVVFVKDVKAGWYVPRPWAHDDVLKVTANDKPADLTQDRRTEVTLGNPGLLLRQDLLDLLTRGPWLYGEPRAATAGQTSDPYVDNYNALLKLVSDDKATQCYYFDRDHLVVLQAECVVDYLPLQLALIDGLIPATPVGDFSRSFPDVAELAKHLLTLSLGDLQTFFEAEKNRTGDQIELPVVKVPGEAVTSWGAAILIALLCYFGIVLREFSLRVTPVDKAWNVPWIGTSRDILSQIAFLASLLFALFAVGYLAVRGAQPNPTIFGWLAYGLAAASAAAAFAFTMYSWKKVLARTQVHR